MISGDNQRAEAETSSALHNLGATIDEHDFLSRVAFLRRSFVGSAILSSSMSSLCCHEIKTLIHLRAPRLPALSLCLDIEIRRDRRPRFRSSFPLRVPRSLFRSLPRSPDSPPVCFCRAKLSPRSTLQSTFCPHHHR